MTLTVGSLFSGIGGLDLGLERAGMKVVWQVEKDEYARRVLAKHWPDVDCFEDVRNVCGRGCNTDPDDCHLRPVDLICGGFPCQDISVAGKGKGIKEGTRSGLWSEFHRIVRELRPRYVLVENVSALRSRGLDRVLGDLASSGYDSEWDCIPAAAVGAPHRRDRIFIVAYAQRDLVRVEPRRGSGAHGESSLLAAGNGSKGVVPHAASEPCQLPQGARQDVPTTPRHGGQRAVADPKGIGQQRAGPFSQSAREEFEAAQRGGPQGNSRPSESAVGRSPDGISAWLDGSWEHGVPRVAHGVPLRVDRLRCLGNAVVPQVAELVGRLIVEHHRKVIADLLLERA